jgi:hypothetical protein
MRTGPTSLILYAMYLRTQLYRLLLLCCVSMVMSMEVAYAAPDSSAPIPAPNPEVVGRWLLDETEGPTGKENWGIYDQSGHNNHGYRDPLGTLVARPNYSTNTPNQTPPNSAPWNNSLDFNAGPSSIGLDTYDKSQFDPTGTKVVIDSPHGGKGPPMHLIDISASVEVQ